MTETGTAATRWRLTSPKFRCEKCGRLFIFPPTDGIDHYYPPHQKEGGPCMGRVIPAAEGAKS